MADARPNPEGAIPSPQPLGVFPLPAGYLLVPDGEDHDAVREALVEGRRPETFPAGLRFLEHALDGDAAAALEAVSGDDFVASANRFVLDPNAERLVDLVEPTGAYRHDANARLWVETLSFIVGLRAEPPSVATLPEAPAGEFAALAHAARATRALERRDLTAATEELDLAAQAARPVSQPMTGQLLGQLAHVQLDEGGTRRAAVTFQAAIDALASSELFVTRAELHVAAGSMHQEMSEAAPRLMQQAIDHYLQALALDRREERAGPVRDRQRQPRPGLHHDADERGLRPAALRRRGAADARRAERLQPRRASRPLGQHAAQSCQRAGLPMPSKHQADNIAEAVGLYEGVLQRRSRDDDPQGRARVLANQGNALAHLGAFDDAKSKLHESRSIFEEFAEQEAVRSVRAILDEIAKQESIARQARVDGGRRRRRA